MAKTTKKQSTQKADEKFQRPFAWVQAYKVKKSANGNLLVFLNATTAISLHPNFITHVMKKAS